MDLNELRYPIGEFQSQDSYTPSEIKSNIQIISALPSKFINLLGNWDDHKLDTPYRPDGWTVRQLIHHVADSHINAYCRFKLALTEDNPTIKPYEEKLWSEMNDVQKLPVNISITLLYALHTRWYEALKYVKDDEWNNRTVFHPEQKRTMRLWYLLGNYAWHCRHHVAHIAALREKKGW